MEGLTAREARSSSESSDFSGDDSTATSCLDSPMTYSMTTEWTDEKHSQYLKSMEASFVNQLYNSLDLLGSRLQKENLSDPKLSSQNTRTLSGQFKVLRGGCWQSVNFRKTELQASKADGSQALPTNPWIRHFRSSSKHQAIAPPTLQENAASLSEEIHSGAKSHAHSCYQDSVGSHTEVSGQNFVDDDDDVEGENASSMCGAKRMKTLVAGSSNDQVVPLGKSRAMAEVTKKYVSPDR